MEQPPYDLPSTLASGVVWTDWNTGSSPETAPDANNCYLNSSWEVPINFLPECYASTRDSWSDHCGTPLSAFFPAHRTESVPQFSMCSLDSTIFIPAFNDADPAHQFNPQQEPFNQSPFPLAQPSKPGCPSESERSVSIQAMPSTHSTPTSSRVTKSPIRCFEHSCGGRAFSSPGNYERHLREKSGRAKSFTCELCGQRFTRSTAKNKHIRYGRCRIRSVR